MIHEFWIWFALLLLAPLAGVWGLVQGRRRQREEQRREAERQESGAPRSN